MTDIRSDSLPFVEATIAAEILEDSILGFVDIGGLRRFLAQTEGVFSALGVPDAMVGMSISKNYVRSLRKGIDLAYVKTLTEERLAEPALVMIDVPSRKPILLDGRHRIVALWMRGQRLIQVRAVPSFTVQLFRHETREACRRNIQARLHALSATLRLRLPTGDRDLSRYTPDSFDWAVKNGVLKHMKDVCEGVKRLVARIEDVSQPPFLCLTCDHGFSPAIRLPRL
jgi:hypothetical protein